MPNPDTSSGFGYLIIDWEPSIASIREAYDLAGWELQSLKKPLEQSVRQVVNPAIATNFTSGGRPSWKGLEPSTVAEKALHNFRPEILQRTGSLKAGASAFRRWTFTRETAEYYVAGHTPYGAAHQDGYWNVRAKKQVVARPYAKITPDEENAVEEILEEFIVGVIEKHLGRL